MNYFKNNILMLFLTIILMIYSSSVNIFSKHNISSYRFYHDENDVFLEIKSNTQLEIKNYNELLELNRLKLISIKETKDIPVIKTDLVSKIIEIENNISQITTDTTYRSNLEWQQKTIIQSLNSFITISQYDSLKNLTHEINKYVQKIPSERH